MRYAVYVSGSGNRVKRALELNEELSAKVKVIVSDNPGNLILKDFFTERNIKYFLIDYSKIEAKDKNKYLSGKMLDIFIENEIDYCFSFGKHLLKGELLEKYAYHIINFHPSLLPQFPGFKAIDQAIENNSRYLGNTVHFIDESIDAGPIILQNVTLADIFFEKGYDAILDEQIVLWRKLDELLSKEAIHIIDGRVKIDGADYQISNIYPKV